MNNGKYDTDTYKKKQRDIKDKRYGPVDKHQKVCESCDMKFEWVGRINTKAYKHAKFCSRSCANNRTAWWKINATQYRTICFNHHEKQCVICGEEKIVEVHHLDHDKANNNPSNLIPLCPTHHQYWHSKFKSLIEDAVWCYANGWSSKLGL